MLTQSLDVSSNVYAINETDLTMIILPYYVLWSMYVFNF